MLEELAFNREVTWTSKHDSFQIKCPLESAGKVTVRLLAGRPWARCSSGCSKDSVLAALAIHTNGQHKNGTNGTALTPPVEESKPTPAARPKKERPAALPAPTHHEDDLLRRLPPQNLEAEQSILGAILIRNELIEEALAVLGVQDFYREAHRKIFGAMLQLYRSKRPVDPVTLNALMKGELANAGGPAYLAELADTVPDPSRIRTYAQIVKDTAIKRELAMQATRIASLAYNGVSVDALLGETQRLLTPVMTDAPTSDIPQIIPWENYDSALVANEEYLKRTPVVDKLCYSSAVSMITGGKHAGKSTLARWMAICIAKGMPFLGRSVQSGPVLYIASEDETMAARQELIRLGWNSSDHLRFLSKSRIEIDDQRLFLLRLTQEITEMHAAFVVIDMLFDFIPVSDEMSYAGTREAVGLIQGVASASGAHIVAIHHAPKNALIGDAAIAALGSQGLAARVSPIILVRRFGPNVHSI